MTISFDLGEHSRPTSTAAAAQQWFDHGLVWCYGFHHEEAVRCFEAAIAVDPDFALAHWGIAYALGPDYNKGWDAFDQVELRQSVARAYEALARARELDASPVERALIDALSLQFASGTPGGDLERWS